MRHLIAIHGAGHALIQIAHGARKLDLRMPSFADAPHVVAIAPKKQRLPHPAPSSGDIIEDGINLICYLVSGTCAHHFLDDGDYHYIACSSDLLQVSELCDLVADKAKIDTTHLLVKSISAVNFLLQKHWTVVESIAEHLHNHGIASGNYLQRKCMRVERKSTAERVLATLHDSVTDDESRRYKQIISLL